MSTDELSGPIPAVYWTHTPPRPKFQHNYRRHLLFFVLTLITTTFASATFELFISPFIWVSQGTFFNPFGGFTWDALRAGLWYSLPVLTILSAHEFGHYFACRHHNVDATLPYFIPAPLPLTGTLGAVIRIREAFPSKPALFDIGVAGPIAGFVVMVPFLYWGITMSHLTPIPVGSGAIYFGEPLLWKIFEWMHFGLIPRDMDVALHPVGFAAWWGMLAKPLNLLPFGQLDGGHIMYAALGRRASWFSGATLVTVVLLSLRSSSWSSMAAMMAVMAMLCGFRHPRIVDEHEPLDSNRRLIAIWALMIFVLCFTPVPIDITGE